MSSSPAIPCWRLRGPNFTTWNTAPTGLDQCLDLVERAMSADTPQPNLSGEWLIGGRHRADHDRHPCHRPANIADCYISLRDDGGFELTVGTAEFGNGTATVHRQIAATALATTVDRIRLKQSDTANGGHDTGAYGSAGTFVAGLATKVGGGKSGCRDQDLCGNSYECRDHKQCVRT